MSEASWKSIGSASGEVSLLPNPSSHTVEVVEETVSRTIYRSPALAPRDAQQPLAIQAELYELRIGQHLARVNRELDPAWLRSLLHAPQEVLHGPAVQHLKSSSEGLVAVVPAPHRPIVIAQFNSRTWLERWLGMWRRSPALHCFRMATQLHAASIPVARPLGFMEQRSYGRLLHSYLLMEHLEQTCPLSRFWHVATYDQQRSIVEQLASMIEPMHRHSISHRDLKVINVLVRQKSDQSLELFLIDYRGVSASPWQMQRRRRKDLARLALSAMASLHASHSTLLRFLLHYLPPEQRAAWKQDWRTIARLMQRKIRQNLRRQRILS